MPKLVQAGPNWSKLGHAGPSWPKLVRAGPNWSKLVQIGPSCPKLAQACPSWSKLAQAGPSVFSTCGQRVGTVLGTLSKHEASVSKPEPSVSKPEASVSKPEPSVSKPEPRNPNPKRHAWPRAATELALAFKDVSKCPHARVRRALGFGHASASSTPSPDLEPLAPPRRTRKDVAPRGVHEVCWRAPRGPAQFLNPCAPHWAQTLTLRLRV